MPDDARPPFGPGAAAAEDEDEAAARERLRSIFDFFDKDGNGFLDATEIGAVLRAFGSDPTDVEVREIIADADANSDGQLSFDEFLELITRELQNGAGTEPREIFESFRIFDRERNGLISTSDFTDILTNMGQKLPLAEVERMIKLCDVNADGMIDYEKFIQTVISAPMNATLLDS